MQRAEAEPLDDQGHERGDGPVGDHGEAGDGEQEPEFGVQEGLAGLCDLEVLVAQAGVVAADARRQDVPLSLAEALGSDRVRWEDEVEEDPPGDGEGACEVVHVSPRANTAVDLSEAEVDEG